MGSFKQDIQETYLGLSESVREKWDDFTQFLQEAWPLLILLLVILMGIGGMRIHRLQGMSSWPLDHQAAHTKPLEKST